VGYFKFIWKFVFYAAALLLVTALWDTAADMVSAPDDVKVAIGFLLYAFDIALMIIVAYRLYHDANSFLERFLKKEEEGEEE